VCVYVCVYVTMCELYECVSTPPTPGVTVEAVSVEEEEEPGSEGDNAEEEALLPLVRVRVLQYDHMTRQ